MILRYICISFRYIWKCFPLEDHQSWSAVKRSKMRPLMLFILVWLWSAALCLSWFVWPSARTLLYCFMYIVWIFFSMPTGCTCSVLLLVGLGGMELHEPYQQWTARQDQTKEAHGPGESGEKRRTLLGVSPVADEVVSETVIIIQRKTDHPLWKVFF